tara:strand:+ start:167 stop:433 length:267 start_codon:yes stop_codon:yes gene_type:complete
VLAFRIVEHLDLVEHILSGVGSCLLGSPLYPLSLEQVEEALGNGIVVTVSTLAHRVFQVVMLQERCPVHAGEDEEEKGGQEKVLMKNT